MQGPDAAPVVTAVAAAAQPFVNWQVNFWDLVVMAAAATVLYSRLTTLETKITPLWNWWNSTLERRVHEHGDERA